MALSCRQHLNFRSATADKFVSCTHLLLLLPSPLRLSNDDDGRGIGHTEPAKKIANMLAVLRQIRGTEAFGAMVAYENALLMHSRSGYRNFGKGGRKFFE